MTMLKLKQRFQPLINFFSTLNVKTLKALSVFNLSPFSQQSDVDKKSPINGVINGFFRFSTVSTALIIMIKNIINKKMID